MHSINHYQMCFLSMWNIVQNTRNQRGTGTIDEIIEQMTKLIQEVITNLLNVLSRRNFKFLLQNRRYFYYIVKYAYFIFIIIYIC